MSNRLLLEEQTAKFQRFCPEGYDHLQREETLRLSIAPETIRFGLVVVTPTTIFYPTGWSISFYCSN